MRTSIRALSQSVETLLTTSAVDLPLRTRQRQIFFIVGILLAGTDAATDRLHSGVPDALDHMRGQP